MLLLRRGQGRPPAWWGACVGVRVRLIQSQAHLVLPTVVVTSPTSEQDTWANPGLCCGHMQTGGRKLGLAQNTQYGWSPC